MPFFGKSGTPRMSCLNLSIPNLTMLQFLRAIKRGLQPRKSGHIIAAPAGKHQTKSMPISFAIVARVAQRQQSAILALFGIGSGAARRVYAFVQLWRL